MIASGDLFESEYALWANFPLDAQDQDMEAYQIAAYVMGLFDLDAGYLTKLTQQSAQEADYLEQMELLQYDMLYGEGGAFEGENPYQPTQMARACGPSAHCAPISPAAIWWWKGKTSRFPAKYSRAKRHSPPNSFPPGGWWCAIARCKPGKACAYVKFRARRSP